MNKTSLCHLNELAISMQPSGALQQVTDEHYGSVSTLLLHSWQVLQVLAQRSPAATNVPHSFPLSLQSNAKTVPPQIKPQQLLSEVFPIHYSLIVRVRETDSANAI
jgi:hypothetical protein